MLALDRIIGAAETGTRSWGIRLHSAPPAIQVNALQGPGRNVAAESSRVDIYQDISFVFTLKGQGGLGISSSGPRLGYHVRYELSDSSVGRQ